MYVGVYCINHADSVSNSIRAVFAALVVSILGFITTLISIWYQAAWFSACAVILALLSLSAACLAVWAAKWLKHSIEHIYEAIPAVPVSLSDESGIEGSGTNSVSGN